MKPVGEMEATEVLRELDAIIDLDSLIYTVRQAAIDDQLWGLWEGDSWEHPMVKRWSDLSARMKELIS